MAPISQSGLLKVDKRSGKFIDRRSKIDFKKKSNWQTSLLAVCMIEGLTSQGHRFSGSGKAYKSNEPNLFYFVTTAHNLVDYDNL